MKKLSLLLALLVSTSAFAAKKSFSGSDTMSGAMIDAIERSNMQDRLQYNAGGSGEGEKGLLAGDQGIAPLSREMKPEVQQQLAAKSVSVTPIVLALDGLSILVKKDNPLPSLDLATIVRIYTCEYTQWQQIPGSGVSGAIKVYRRDDKSGTTDAFKHFTGVKNFGPCVTMVQHSDDIMDYTSRDPLAIGYAGGSAKVKDNRKVAIAARPGSPAVLPTDATIRDFSYPMSRRLYLYVVSGAQKPTAVEQEFLDYVSDRNNMDSIMQDHGFTLLD